MNTKIGITIERITGNFGAIVRGVDLRYPLPAESVAYIRQAWVDHGVIFFRDQNIELEQFWSFMKNFGLPQKDEYTGTDNDQPRDVRTSDMAPTRRGTAVWHADTTSLAKPPIATALRAVQPCAYGGDTCWSSMYAAWEGLSEPVRHMLDGLTAIHTIESTIDRMGQYGAGYEAKYRPVHGDGSIHPVVLTHPETGRKALYVSEGFVTRIVELSPQESAAVLAMLFRHVEKPDFCLRWKWSANDISFWDNRSVQHYAVPDYTATRIMQRVVLSGASPVEAKFPVREPAIRIAQSHA